MADGAALLPDPNQGHHLHWMVLAHGVVAPTLVAESIGRRIGDEAAAVPVRAWNP